MGYSINMKVLILIKSLDEQTPLLNSIAYSSYLVAQFRTDPYYFFSVCKIWVNSGKGENIGKLLCSVQVVTNYKWLSNI